MTKEIKEKTENWEKEFGIFLTSIDGKTGVMNHHNISKCKSFIRQLLEEERTLCEKKLREQRRKLLKELDK